MKVSQNCTRSPYYEAAETHTHTPTPHKQDLIAVTDFF